MPAKAITQKITGYKVVTEANSKIEDIVIIPVDILHEGMARPEVLLGSTYKIKSPQFEHAMYITINDVVLNVDTVNEVRLPYEIFINSKNMEHFQWIVALTRVTSAVFRKGGDVTFLVDEMKATFDPKGGYFKKGGIYMPSLVAEIGHIIEKHLTAIGVIKVEVMADHVKQHLIEKRKEFEARNDDSSDEGTFPEKATLCPSCNVKAMVLMDGCMTCLSCGNSKCG